MAKTLKKRKHKWNYPNLIFLALSFLFAIYILTSSFLKSFVNNLGIYSYLGAVMAGVFFAYAFTAAPATASFIILGQTNNPIIIGLLGGLGAMLADFLIFSYIKHHMSSDLKYIVKKTGITKLKKLRYTKMGWIVPLFAGIIIASPLPDELGSFMFGISNYSTKKFLIYSFILNSIGITIVASLG